MVTRVVSVKVMVKVPCQPLTPAATQLWTVCLLSTALGPGTSNNYPRACSVLSSLLSAQAVQNHLNHTGDMVTPGSAHHNIMQEMGDGVCSLHSSDAQYSTSCSARLLTTN